MGGLTGGVAGGLCGGAAGIRIGCRIGGLTGGVAGGLCGGAAGKRIGCRIGGLTNDLHSICMDPEFNLLVLNISTSLPCELTFHVNNWINKMYKLSKILDFVHFLF